jgi:hypothetical protein
MLLVARIFAETGAVGESCHADALPRSRCYASLGASHADSGIDTLQNASDDPETMPKAPAPLRMRGARQHEIVGRLLCVDGTPRDAGFDPGQGRLQPHDGSRSEWIE